jgi:riboflavin-specific deaminase-like protein
MQVLIPPPALRAPLEPAVDVAPYDFYRPADPRAPLLRVNMVASVDGRVTDAHGRSGGLGSDADLAAFRAMRAMADAILVGAGTARTEGYGPHLIHASVAGPRLADGRDQPAAIVVVSASLDLDPASRLFREAATRTVVLTCAAAPPGRRAALAEVADVVTAGTDRVDLTDGLARLHQRGLAHVLCEGGPRLNAGLLAADLVDELCLTIAPLLLLGEGPRLVEPYGAAGLAGDHTLALLALGRVEQELFARYTVHPEPPADVGPGAA